MSLKLSRSQYDYDPEEYTAKKQQITFRTQVAKLYYSKTPKITYVGDICLGIEHGKGIANYVDNATYEGEFFVGKRHGKGTFKYGNITIQGVWEYGLPLNTTNIDISIFKPNGKFGLHA